MEQYQIVQGKKLKCGYTTGSCATAAAKAAAMMLFTDEDVEQVRIMTPKGVPLNLEVEAIVRSMHSVSCAVRKDAGDDYDDTNGILIFAEVEKTAAMEIEIGGGEGVGRVTQAGLACKQGGPAINPTPQRMIREELLKISQQYAYLGGFKVTISAPQGAEIAKKTFNPRLGIVGGISVLGTSGIVEPMSEKALIATIYTEMDVQAARGVQDLLVFFGNYGEDYARDVLRLDLRKHVTCSNFVGEALDYATYKGFKSVLLIGHAGKLVKVAQGVMNTHSKYADCRTEALALAALQAGADRDTTLQIAAALTTDAAIKIIKEANLFEVVMRQVMAQIDKYLQLRTHARLQTGAVMFSNAYGLLGMTESAQSLINRNQEEERLEQ